MIYGYARVSTHGQAQSGNSLEAQEATLRSYGADVIFYDSFTGKKIERPQLEELLSLLKEGDVLMATRLDRIARSLRQGVDLVNALIEKGVKVHILDIGVLDNTAASQLIRNIFFSFAEFERNLIIERCREGKAIAKQNPNFKEGSPRKFTDEQRIHAVTLLEKFSYKEVSWKCFSKLSRVYEIPSPTLLLAYTKTALILF